MPNVTQFPIADVMEFVRVYPQGDENAISYLSVFPMRNFRMNAEDFLSITQEAVKYANKAYEPEEPTKMMQLVNHEVNVALNKANAEGRLIFPEEVPGIVELHELLTETNNRGMIPTNDGYVSLMVAHLPHSPSAYKN